MGTNDTSIDVQNWWGWAVFWQDMVADMEQGARGMKVKEKVTRAWLSGEKVEIVTERCNPLTDEQRAIIAAGLQMRDALRAMVGDAKRGKTHYDCEVSIPSLTKAIAALEKAGG